MQCQSIVRKKEREKSKRESGDVEGNDTDKTFPISLALSVLLGFLKLGACTGNFGAETEITTSFSHGFWFMWGLVDKREKSSYVTVLFLF